MIAGLGLLKCNGACEYGKRNPINSGHPPSNLYGYVGAVRMDGSIFFRIRPQECTSATMGHNNLFFAKDLTCKASPVTPI